MSAFRSWATSKTGGVVLTMIGAIGSAIIIQNFTLTDDYWPASRSWVRGVRDEAARVRDEKVARQAAQLRDLTIATKSSLERKLEEMDRRSSMITDNQITSKLAISDLTLVILNQELSTLELRVKAFPNEGITVARRTAVLSLIRSEEEKRKRLICLSEHSVC